MPMVTRPEFLPGLPNWSRKTFFALALAGICFAFAFPVLWLILTSLRPESGVYYVHRGTEFTLGNFKEVLGQERIVDAFINSAVISTLATVFSLLVTVSSGYMLSRFTGPASRHMVRHHLRVPLRALYLLGAAALLRGAELGHLRHLYRAAAAAYRRAHLLLLLADEGLFRRHRPLAWNMPP